MSADVLLHESVARSLWLQSTFVSRVMLQLKSATLGSNEFGNGAQRRLLLVVKVEDANVGNVLVGVTVVLDKLGEPFIMLLEDGMDSVKRRETSNIMH